MRQCAELSSAALPALKLTFPYACGFEAEAPVRRLDVRDSVCRKVTASPGAQRRVLVDLPFVIREFLVNMICFASDALRTHYFPHGSNTTETL